MGLAARIAFIDSRTGSGGSILPRESDVALSHPQRSSLCIAAIASSYVRSSESGLTVHALSAVTTDVVCSDAA